MATPPSEKLPYDHQIIGALMPSPEEAERKREWQEEKHKEDLKLRPYMDHSFSKLIELLILSIKHGPEYNKVMKEIDYRERKWNERGINPLTDRI